jgi:5-methyltetrahydropteroyltriglutamate--homocysteine methyltransferase
MLARTLLDEHYGEFGELTMGIARVMSAQVRNLPCDCIQIDEANIPGNLADVPLAAEAINTVLDAIDRETKKAVHFCFGNYGGQTIQAGNWKAMTKFLNSLRVDHLVLELARRPDTDIEALADIDDTIGLGIGVVDIKVNHIETADEIARSIEKVEKRIGEGRVKYVHPDCGFWMLKRSIVDRKIVALARGRDKYLGI